MYLQANILILIPLVSLTLNSARAQKAGVVCPAVRTTSGWLDLFPLPCLKHADCTPMGARHLCCKGYCTKGVKNSATLRTNDQSGKSSVVPSSSSSTSTTTTTTTPTTTTTTTTTPSTTTTTTTPSTTTSSTTMTTTTPRPTTTTEPPRPFLQILPIKSAKASEQKTNKVPAKNGKSQKLVCPKPGQAPLILFPIPCEKTSHCRASGADQVCCEKRCVRGVPAPRPSTPPPTHQPLLGVIPRECPAAPLGELLFEVQPCRVDADCWPRVCCPDGGKSYCRTARARLDLVPIANQIDRPVRMLEQYLQCTAPPQYDLFPKRCSSSVDCFPNLCCAEGGQKHCRPPQRSLLALLAGVSQRIGSIRQNQANQNTV